MNLSQRTSLSLLFVSLSTVPAHAALSGNSESSGVAIETAAESGALQSIDHLLGGGNHPDLFDSVLQRHKKSAQSSKTLMEGHFDGEGSADQLASFGQQESQRPAPQSTPAAPPDSARANNARLGGNSSSPDLASIAVMSSSSASPNNSFTPTEETVTGPATIITGSLQPTPVPLPAAGLLLASGLVGIPVLRRKRATQG